MAAELEQTVMTDIGLNRHYSWFNGSRSCRGIRQSAIARLPGTAKIHGLTISPEWMEQLNKADIADQINSGDSGLTNVWVMASYAIQDAIYRQEGDAGFPPSDDDGWFFWNEAKREQFMSLYMHRIGDREGLVNKLRTI